jgi:hypothetical protein
MLIFKGLTFGHFLNSMQDLCKDSEFLIDILSFVHELLNPGPANKLSEVIKECRARIGFNEGSSLVEESLLLKDGDLYCQRFS